MSKFYHLLPCNAYILTAYLVNLYSQLRVVRYEYPTLFFKENFHQQNR